MIPYFIVLVVLAMYGLHRYWLVYDYYASTRAIFPGRRRKSTEWPRVTVQLPILQRALRDRAAGRSGGAVRLPARTAGYSGAGRFDRRDAAGGARLRGALSARWACQSATSIATIARDSKPARLQEGLEDGARRIHRHFRRGFYSASGFSAPHRALFRRHKAWRWCRRAGATSTATIRADGSGSDSARRAFRDRAFGARSRSGTFLQFQRHRRHLAARRRLKMPAAGSTTRSPKTPIFPIARSCAAGNSSICRRSSARRNCRWR